MADTLIADVRDGTEAAASAKIKGAPAISRGLLESKVMPPCRSMIQPFGKTVR